MKTRLLAALAFFLLFAGCKQDIDLTAPYQEVTVVYGLLSKNDTKHYIRIQKGYLIDGDATVAAGVPDSIYYPDVLSVRLIPYLNGNQNGQVFTLTRVDGNTENPPVVKDSGTFSTSPNILYTFTGTLDPTRLYRLEIINNENGKVIRTSTKLVQDFVLSSPSYRGQRIGLSSSNPFKFLWTTAAGAEIYDVKVRFPYKEYEMGSNTFLRNGSIEVFMAKTLFSDDTTGVTSEKVNFEPAFLYNELNNKLQPSSNCNCYREFDASVGLTISVSAGGTELAKYMNAQNAQNSGLISNEALPPYTNINGGYGLLSSRLTVQIDSVLLNNDAIDSLACSPFTTNLKFKNTLGQFCQ